MVDWWDRLLKQHEKDGARDASEGHYSPPWTDDSDPQNESENHAYRRGWDKKRASMGDEYKWTP